MNTYPLIDTQRDPGTATDQVFVWNNTTLRLEPSVTLSGLTLVSPDITGTVNAGGDPTAFGGDLTGERFISDDSGSGLAFIFKDLDSGFAYQKVTGTDIVWVQVDGSIAQDWTRDGGDNLLSTIYSDLDVTGNITTGQFIGDTTDRELIEIDGAGGIVTVGGDVLAERFCIPVTTALVGTIEQDSKRFLHSFGTDSVFLGKNAGNFTLTGIGNLGIGPLSLFSLTNGQLNVGLGSQSLELLESGDGNMAIGKQSLGNITTGDANVAIGRNAGITLTTSSASNTIIGTFSGSGSVVATNNVFIGRETGGTLTGTPSNNVLLGYRAGRTLSGDNNVCIGREAGRVIGSASSSVIIGFKAGYDETGSDTFILDNEDRTSEALGRSLALMYGLFENHASGPWLTVNGDFNATGNVRIGDTTAPTKTLEVAGTLGVEGIATFETDIVWNGNSVLDCSDDDKTVDINNNGTFTFRNGSLNWLVLNTAGNSIDFGEGDILNPAYNFLGTGALTTGGGRIVSITDIDDTDSPYTALESDHEIFIDTDTAAVTINLPAGVAGTKYRIINTGSSSNDVTVAPNGAELLTGANASRTLSDSSVIILAYNTTKGWY